MCMFDMLKDRWLFNKIALFSEFCLVCWYFRDSTINKLLWLMKFEGYKVCHHIASLCFYEWEKSEQQFTCSLRYLLLCVSIIEPVSKTDFRCQFKLILWRVLILVFVEIPKKASTNMLTLIAVTVKL